MPLNPGIHTFIHLEAVGQPSALQPPDWMSAMMSIHEGWQLIMSVFTEIHTGRCVSFWQSLVLEVLTVPGEHKCAPASSLHQWEGGENAPRRSRCVLGVVEDKEEWY